MKWEAATKKWVLLAAVGVVVLVILGYLGLALAGKSDDTALAEARAALDAADLKHVEIGLNGRALRLGGEVENQDERLRAQVVVELLQEDPVRKRKVIDAMTIRVAPPPPNLVLSLRGGEIFISGELANGYEVGLLRDRLESLHWVERLVFQVRPGRVDEADWLPGYLGLLDDLASLRRVDAELVDGVLTFSGFVPDALTRAAILNRARVDCVGLRIEDDLRLGGTARPRPKPPSDEEIEGLIHNEGWRTPARRNDDPRSGRDRDDDRWSGGLDDDGRGGGTNPDDERSGRTSGSNELVPANWSPVQEPARTRTLSVLPADPRTAERRADPRATPPSERDLVRLQERVDDLVRDSVVFANSRTELTSSSRRTIDDLADVLRQEPKVMVLIEGHSDSRGNAQRNLNLSQRRAESVVDELVRSGVDRSRLMARGLGSERPIADNSTAAGRDRNRRVEVHLMLPGRTFASDSPSRASRTEDDRPRASAARGRTSRATAAPAAGPSLGPSRPSFLTLPQLRSLQTRTDDLVRGAVQFARYRTKLTLSSEEVVDDLADLLRDLPMVEVLVEGHSDSRGDSAQNLELSYLRARSVVQRLADAGIDPSLLTAEGFGSSRPIADNRTAAGRDRNRRIEVSLRADTVSERPTTRRDRSGAWPGPVSRPAESPTGPLNVRQLATLRERTSNLVRQTMLFRSGSAQLAAQSEQVIELLAGMLESAPNVDIRIEGRVSPSGNPLRDLELSQRRADVVAERLVNAGLDSNRIIATGLGSSLSDITTEDRDRSNEILLRVDR
ncbi:MAG: OmpA family protein [Acidobacteriota bacterium]